MKKTNLKNEIKFKYYDYKKDLFEETITQSEEAEIYLCENYNDLNEAVRSYNPRPLSLQNKFLTLKEFKKRLFSSEKIVLKEEKLPIILYSVLKDREKKDLRLENYNDIRQFSAQFFDYFNLIIDYQITEFKDLTSWQKQRIETLKNIKKRYQNKLKEYSYTDFLTLKEEKKLNIDFLQSYKKINFFNIMAVTPYFKEILEKMLNYSEIEFQLQLQEGDFSEKDLKLNKITLPSKHGKIEIRKNNSKLKSTAAFLNEKEKSEKKAALMDSGQQIEAAEILSDKFKINSKMSFSETKIYKLLDNLYQLYQNGKDKNNILIELKLLFDLTTQKLFKKWLDLKADDLEEIKSYLAGDYYYLNRKKINKNIPSLIKLINFLEKLKNLKSIAALADLITEEFDFAISALNKETAEKFNDGLLELKSIEEMGLVTDWKDYYSDQGAGLFSLFLNHLNYKTVSLAENEKAVEFHTINNASQKPKKKLLINNVVQSNFAQKQGGLYFLSEKQLQENGIQLKHQSQLLKKYKLLRHIFNAEETIIFTVENESENISPAIILEELVLQYQLEIKESALNNLSEKEILNNIFAYPSSKTLKIDHDFPFNQNFKVEKDDFGSSYNFSYYKYKNLKDCYHRFYLERLAAVETKLEITPSLSLMALGTLTHQIFADIIIYAKKKQLKPAAVPAAVKKKIIGSIIQENKLKIDKDYLNYYQQIIFQSLESAFNRFADLVEKYLPVDFDNILIEWPQGDYPKQKHFQLQETDFFLSGRIDLFLLNKLKDKYFVIDFKTGSGDKKQLDFYSLMLRHNYKKQLPSLAKKAIYNVFSETFEHSYHREDKENDLSEEIKTLTAQLFALGEYDRVYKSRCHNCPYHEICRVEVQNNEESH